jgi:hypothetical protein
MQGWMTVGATNCGSSHPFAKNWPSLLGTLKVLASHPVIMYGEYGE